VIEWGQELEQQYQAWQAEHGRKKIKSATASKRSADSMDDAPVKKAKTASGAALSKGSEALDDEDMRKRFDGRTVNKVSFDEACTFAIESLANFVADVKCFQLTVPVLKAWAHKKHISTDGLKKADLVERIEEYFESK